MNIRLIAAALGAGIVLSGIAVAAEPQQTGTLRVEVDGLSSSQPVHIGLWSSESEFLGANALKGAEISVDNGTAVWVIKNLPYGSYAVGAWQDLNGNGKLDDNSFHAPVEPVGVSNNAQGHYGPPAYKDAKFNLDKSRMQVTFKLSCPMGCADK
ncbi:MAG TPA: DUF2141 domain-containing protein [Gammaproteobacteria bacterium]|nr:DUF2141 domain-containing protein [Gammaproteobacteria bacterium]